MGLSIRPLVTLLHLGRRNVNNMLVIRKEQNKVFEDAMLESFITDHVQGAFVGPGAFASIPLSSRPTDSPANSGLCDAGATYSVASFHTHPPNEFRAVAFPLNVTQTIGPSTADNNVDNGDDVPGVVYDHEESPAGSGAVPMGHPESSPAIRYHSRGKNNRSTPN